MEQVHVVLGAEGIAFDHEGFYAASVLSTILGGGMSSRLFQEIRERRGLAYVIYSFLSCYKDCGIFGVYCGTGAEEARGLLSLVLDEIEKVQNDVTEEELNRARAQLKASILMSLESTSARCEQLARQMMVFGRPVPFNEIVQRIDGADRSSVTDVARRVFAGRPSIAAIGPIGELCDYEMLSTRLSK